jgi:low affinity Fe/Cu permease
MKELTFGMMIAVFEEMFGAGLFWLLVILATALLGIFVWLVSRDRDGFSIRFLRAELSAPIGALLAVVFVQYITNSGFTDIGGPIDVIVLLMIATGGAIASTMVFYVLSTLVGSRRSTPEAR